jgi:fluoride exporter
VGKVLDWPGVAVVSAGGVLGALARYGIAVGWPHQPGAFPWATWAVNVSGCFLIGVLSAVLQRRPAHPLVRPFLGVGVLGGYTTFSTAAVETLQSRPAVALAYLAATLTGALVAVWCGATLARPR